MGLWPSWKTVACVVAAVAVGVVVAAAVVAAAPVVLAAAGVSAAAIAAGTVGGAAVTAVSIVVAGAAAGAVGYGLNEGLEHGFHPKCILKEALRGAGIGAVAALPFAALPFAPLLLPAGAAAIATGTGGVMAAGGMSGGISYMGEIATNPDAKFSWLGLGEAVAGGAATAGLLHYGAGKIGQIRAARAAKAAVGKEPVGPVNEAEPGGTSAAEEEAAGKKAGGKAEETEGKAVDDEKRCTGGEPVDLVTGGRC